MDEQTIRDIIDTLYSVLGLLRTQRGNATEQEQVRALSITITHIEDALFRLEQQLD